MTVTIYEAEWSSNGRKNWSYFVSDGEGDDISVRSAAVAGAVAYVLGVRKGLKVSGAVAAMFERQGAARRKFEAGKAESIAGEHVLIVLQERLIPPLQQRACSDRVFMAIDARDETCVEAAMTREAVTNAVRMQLRQENARPPGLGD